MGQMVIPGRRKSERKVPYSVFDDLLLAVVFFASLKKEGKTKETKTLVPLLNLKDRT